MNILITIIKNAHTKESIKGYITDINRSYAEKSKISGSQWFMQLLLQEWNMMDGIYLPHGVELLDEAQQRNFVQYPFLGINIWPNLGFPESGSYGYTAPTSGGAQTLQEEIDKMKNFISQRLVWMDKTLPRK